MVGFISMHTVRKHVCSNDDVEYISAPDAGKEVGTVCINKNKHGRLTVLSYSNL